MARFTASRARIAVAFGLATLGALASFEILGRPAGGTDDANIILVYARNLARGDGLVFTPGFERVEGFSTPAWTALASAGFLVTPAPEAALLVLSVGLAGVCLACVLAMVEALARAAPRGGAGAASGLRPGSLLAAAWLLMIPSFYAWTTISLMECALWAALLQLAALWLVVDATAARPGPGAVAALAGIGLGLLLTRPEGLAAAPLVVLLALGSALARGQRPAPALRRLAPAFAAVAVGLVGLELSRWLYFGELLPNTYYAKVSPDPLYTLRDGAGYLLGFWREEPVAAVLSLVAAVRGLRIAARAAGRRRGQPALGGREAGVLAVSGIALGGLALPLVEGGDYFGGHRFYQPFVPMLVVPLADQLRDWSARLGTGRRRALAVGLTLLALGVAGASWQRFAATTLLAREFELAEKGRGLGAALDEVFAGGSPPRVAAIATGGLGFRYGGRVVDLMGLSWKAMAHAPGDRKGVRNHAAFRPAVFWKEEPEIVTPNLHFSRLESACDLRDPFADVVLQRLTATRRFRSRYAAGYLDTPQGLVSGYFLRSWVDEAGPPGLVLFSPDLASCGPTRG